MKNLITFVSIAFAVALAAKTAAFIIAICGGTPLESLLESVIELGVAWLIVLVGCVVYVCQLARGFGRPRVIPFPLPFPVRADEGDTEGDTEGDGKPDGDGTENATGADGKPDGDTTDGERQD